jgi:hypothetical protein
MAAHAYLCNNRACLQNALISTNTRPPKLMNVPLYAPWKRFCRRCCLCRAACMYGALWPCCAAKLLPTRGEGDTRIEENAWQGLYTTCSRHPTAGTWARRTRARADILHLVLAASAHARATTKSTKSTVFTKSEILLIPAVWVLCPCSRNRIPHRHVVQRLCIWTPLSATRQLARSCAEMLP